MSEVAARAALARMNMREVAIAAHYTGLMADLRQMADTDPIEAQARFMEQRRGELCAAYGFSNAPQNKPFAFALGIAIIPVSGTLINRFGQSYGYVTGYNFIRSQLNLALLDEDVTAIVFDCNSYGGEAAGCFELSDDIFAARGTKPLVAVVDSNCYSACYAVASACDKIVVTPTGGAGSIGVVAMHVDMSKMLADWGIKVEFIFSGDHKVDGNPYEALPKEVRADIQKGVDASRTAFVGLVARNRSLDAKVVHDTEARIYRAEEAKSLGLIDAIATPSAAVQSLFGELSGSTVQQQEEESMSAASTEVKPGAETTATTQQAQTEARTAERTRIAGIQSCEEAKGREALANHLAMNTEMSVETAKGVLAAAPKTAAAEPEKTTPNASANRFKEAMDGGKHPNVGEDAAVAGGGDDPAEAKHLAILRDQERATGVKLTTK
jgi:signal peptide peptidase SppA